jgi:hypothetical protein
VKRATTTLTRLVVVPTRGNDRRLELLEDGGNQLFQRNERHAVVLLETATVVTALCNWSCLVGDLSWRLFASSQNSNGDSRCNAVSRRNDAPTAIPKLQHGATLDGATR